MKKELAPKYNHQEVEKESIRTGLITITSKPAIPLKNLMQS